jgi:hypothetical protein
VRQKWEAERPEMKRREARDAVVRRPGMKTL